MQHGKHKQEGGPCRARDAHHVFGQVGVEGKARQDGLELSKEKGQELPLHLNFEVHCCLERSSTVRARHSSYAA